MICGLAGLVQIVQATADTFRTYICILLIMANHTYTT